MDAAIGSTQFRQVFACLPTAVAVVTTKDGQGLPRGITTNTVAAVSQNPPMLSVCLDRGSATLAAIRDRGRFAVNFLAETGAGISQVFAQKAPDKFSLIRQPWTDAGGGPVFADDVVAHAECFVHSEIEMGDHSIIVGVVSGGSTHERAPLMYYRRQYSSWQIDRDL